MALSSKVIRVGLPAAALIVFSLAFIDAMGFTARAQYFPATISGAGALLAAVATVHSARQVSQLRAGAPAPATVVSMDVAPSFEDSEDDGSSPLRRALPHFLWILSYFAILYIFGFVVGTLAFLLLALRILAGWRWWVAAVVSVGVVALLIFFGDFVRLDLPNGLLLPALPF